MSDDAGKDSQASGGTDDRGTTLVVGDADALGENQTVKFRIGAGRTAREGFVIRHHGALHAYRNECRHVPMTMDWVENRFLSRDGCWIQCATHGARYEIATGLCVLGPPAGKALRRLPVAVENGKIVVRIVECGAEPGSADDVSPRDRTA